MWHGIVEEAYYHHAIMQIMQSDGPWFNFQRTVNRGFLFERYRQLAKFQSSTPSPLLCTNFIFTDILFNRCMECEGLQLLGLKVAASYGHQGVWQESKTLDVPSLAKSADRYEAFYGGHECQYGDYK